MIKAILFDLDGTLVDTLGDISDFMNGFLRSKGWPEHPVASYKSMVGRGLANLIRAAIPPDQSGRASELYGEVFELYERMGSGRSEPYPGAREALEVLEAAGVALAVVSNKPQPLVELMVSVLFPKTTFAGISGGAEGIPLKPDPTGALLVARACGAAPSECAFVGDSDVDMKTAKAAGMLAVGAGWGFRGESELRGAGADLVLASAAEIPGLLGR